MRHAQQLFFFLPLVKNEFANIWHKFTGGFDSASDNPHTTHHPPPHPPQTSTTLLSPVIISS